MLIILMKISFTQKPSKRNHFQIKTMLSENADLSPADPSSKQVGPKT